MIRYCSPALDLIYHIFTATDKKTRQTEYTNLIKIYYDQFSLNLRSLGSDPEKLFTFNDLQNELKRCGNYAVIMVPILMQISLANSDDIPDLDEMCEQADNFDLVQTSNADFDKAYKETITEFLEDIINREYYRKLESK